MLSVPTPYRSQSARSSMRGHAAVEHQSTTRPEGPQDGTSGTASICGPAADRPSAMISRPLPHPPPGCGVRAPTGRGHPGPPPACRQPGDEAWRCGAGRRLLSTTRGGAALPHRACGRVRWGAAPPAGTHRPVPPPAGAERHQLRGCGGGSFLVCVSCLLDGAAGGCAVGRCAPAASCRWHDSGAGAMRPCQAGDTVVPCWSTVGA